MDLEGGDSGTRVQGAETLEKTMNSDEIGETPGKAMNSDEIGETVEKTFHSDEIGETVEKTFHSDEIGETLENKLNSDEIKSEVNGSCAEGTTVSNSKQILEIKNPVEANGSRLGETVTENDDKSEEKEIDAPREIPSGTTGSPLDGLEAAPKGLGLKKWRRRRREFVKDGGSGSDSQRILKRLSSNAEPSKTLTRNLGSKSNKQVSEGSISSKNSTSNLGLSPMSSSSLPIRVSDPESRLGIGNFFPVTTDSENSEDRSSKSSTAASVPKLQSEVPTVIEFTSGRNKAKSPSKTSGNLGQKGSQGKTRVDTSKKLRGEKVFANRGKIEKEMALSNRIEDEGSSRVEDDLNSHRESYSSANFDLRCSVGGGGFAMDFASVRTKNGVGAGDGRHIKIEKHNWLSSYDGEAGVRERQENGGEVEDASRENGNGDGLGSTCGQSCGCEDEMKEEMVDSVQRECENRQDLREHDPLVESLIQLQVAQVALEKEIQKFEEIGKEPIVQPTTESNPGLSISGKFDESNLFSQFSSEEREGTSLRPLETEIIKLRRRVNLLERKVEEASESARSKEVKVRELEAILNGTYLRKNKTDGKNVQPVQENCKEMETELEALFKENLAAEIKHLVITRTTRNLKALIDDRVLLFEEQKSLAVGQEEMVMKLKEAEDRALLLKKQAEELETACEELLGTEKVLKMQNKVCKFSQCFLIQFLLLCIAIGFFMFQLMPQSPEFVPT